MTDLRLVAENTARLSRLSTEEEARAHAGLVIGELERLERLRRALLLSGEMEIAAMAQMSAAHQETQDFIRWINDRLAEHMSPQDPTQGA